MTDDQKPITASMQTPLKGGLVRSERQRAQDLKTKALREEMIRRDIERMSAHVAHGYLDTAASAHVTVDDSGFAFLKLDDVDTAEISAHDEKEDSENVDTRVEIEGDGAHVAPTTGHESHDPVNHPVHYNADASGVECIEIIREHQHNVGAAIKYLWRLGLKVLAKDALAAEIQDLKKAVWYLEDEKIRRSYVTHTEPLFPVSYHDKFRHVLESRPEGGVKDALDALYRDDLDYAIVSLNREIETRSA